MGAQNIEIELKGKLNRTEVENAFTDQVENDKLYNGHQEGYSGDFQTVDSVKCHFDKVFDSYDQAHDYCLDNAEKWDYVVAVHYKNKESVNTMIAGWGAC